jgi:uncharacterized C2H2 Zn-finger protein
MADLPHPRPPQPPDAEAAAFVARLEEIRSKRVRSESDPTPWERERFKHDPAGLRQAIRARNDPTLRSYLGLLQAEHQKQARALLAAGPAVHAALSRDLSGLVRPVSYTRGTLTLAVPDDAARFRADRELRAGGQASIIRALPVPVQKVKVVVRPHVPLPEIERTQPLPGEAERERWEEIDTSGGPRSDEVLRCPSCDGEFAAPRPRATDQPRPKAQSRMGLFRLRCPRCAAIHLYRL